MNKERVTKLFEELKAGQAVVIKSKPEETYTNLGGGTATHTWIQPAGGGKKVLVAKADITPVYFDKYWEDKYE